MTTGPPDRPDELPPGARADGAAERVGVEPADEERDDGEHDAEADGGPQQRPAGGDGGAQAVARHDDGAGEADQREQRQEPRQHADEVGEAHASSRRSRLAPIVASVTETSDAAGARSGATAPSTPVTTAPTSEIRSSTESAWSSVRAVCTTVGGPPDRPGQGVAAGDADRHRLDERAQRDEVGVGRDQLVGDLDADLRGDVVVLAQLVDVVDERRAVEHVAVDVAGDQAEGGEEGAEDEQDARRPPSPATARRGARRRARVARPRCSRDRQVDQPAGGVGDGQRCCREQHDASEPNAERRGEAGEEQRGGQQQGGEHVGVGVVAGLTARDGDRSSPWRPPPRRAPSGRRGSSRPATGWSGSRRPRICCSHWSRSGSMAGRTSDCR